MAVCGVVLLGKKGGELDVFFCILFLYNTHMRILWGTKCISLVRNWLKTCASRFVVTICLVMRPVKTRLVVICFLPTPYHFVLMCNSDVHPRFALF